MKPNPFPYWKIPVALLFFVSTMTPAAAGTEDRETATNVGEPKGQQARTLSEPDHPTIDMEGLRHKLEQTGWRVQRASDGSLLLFPDIAPPMKNFSDAPTTPLDRLEQKLRAKGWKTRRDTDGSLILFPPTSMPVQEAPASPVPHPINGEMRKRLESRGWKIRDMKEGAIALLPPAALEKSAPVPCSGYGVAMKLLLPVANAREARLITQAWLKQTPWKDLSVGKVRQVLKVFLVSLVSVDRPHLLRHQIAIRASDGRVILLN